MTFDAETMFSEKQRVAAATPSSAVVQAGANAGDGAPVYVCFAVTESFAGAESLEVMVQDGDAPDGAFATIQTTGPLPCSSLAKGAIIHLGSLPQKSRPWLRLFYSLDGAASAGAVSAGLVGHRTSVPGRQG